MRVAEPQATRLLRHAEPSQCTIEPEVVDGAARLRATNDGTLPADGTAPGTGLAGTVRNYPSSAVQKLGSASRSAAVRTARDHGWL